MTPSTSRVDCVWDNYPRDNIKCVTHQRRGSGPRTRIGDGRTPIPKHNWNEYLKSSDNKRELFSFLSQRIAQHDFGDCQVLSTLLNDVLVRGQCDISHISPCNHIEADTRIFLHLSHAVNHGHEKAYIRTVDSDIIVLALRFFGELKMSELWVCFGTGKKIRDIAIHELYSTLGPSRALAIPLFHSLTGCDSTSHFHMYGKKSAWVAWMNTPGLTDTLIQLMGNPQSFNIDSVHMQRLERFIIIMYSKGCGLTEMNKTRKYLFMSGKKTLETIPPTQAAFVEHVKRSLLQASFYWNNATTAQMDIPDFDKWGWQKDNRGNWIPFWTPLDDVSKACSMLLQCGCEKSCTGNCKCCRAGVQCTSFCRCEGGCINNSPTRNIT